MIVYPAILTKENTGYFISFPDLEGCFSEGRDLKESIKMAEEALGGYVASMFDRNIDIPVPSELTNISFCPKTQSAVLIYSHADKYFSQKKAVKKTLTVPAWLNAKAEQRGLNFSQVLQEALIEQLGI